MTTTTLDERAALVAQRDHLNAKVQALTRQLDAAVLPLVPSYEEQQAREERERRLAFLQDRYRAVSRQVEALDLAARRAEVEKVQHREYFDRQLTAARARLAQVADEESQNLIVQASLARRRERAVGEIATFEAQRRALAPPPRALTVAPAPRGPAMETTPPAPPLIPARARRIPDPLAWSVDDRGDG